MKDPIHSFGASSKNGQVNCLQPSKEEKKKGFWKGFGCGKQKSLFE